MSGCTAPGPKGKPCGRTNITAHGLCNAHYVQVQRGGPLKPLRQPVDEPREVLTIRVSPATRRCARKDPNGARGALDKWARSRPSW